MLKGKNRFGEEKEMQGDHLVKGRRLCLGEDVGGEGCVLMAIKREKEDGRACGWCWFGEPKNGRDNVSGFFFFVKKGAAGVEKKIKGKDGGATCLGFKRRRLGRKIQPSRGERGGRLGRDRFRVRLFPFFIIFSFKIPPLLVC